MAGVKLTRFPCKGKPPALIAKLKADTNAVLATPEIKSHFGRMDVTHADGSLAQFLDPIRADMQRWQQIVQQANIKLN